MASGPFHNKLQGWIIPHPVQEKSKEQNSTVNKWWLQIMLRVGETPADDLILVEQMVVGGGPKHLQDYFVL